MSHHHTRELYACGHLKQQCRCMAEKTDVVLLCPCPECTPTWLAQKRERIEVDRRSHLQATERE